MAGTMVNPTRMELTKLKKKLKTALRGHKLLKDKRDESMRQFLELVKENKRLRESVEEKLHKANQQFALASAGMSAEEMEDALMVPRQDVTLQVSTRNVMSVELPVFEARRRTENPEDIYAYGYAFTSQELDRSIEARNEALPELLQLASCEKSCQLLAAEIEKTRRRVNALEHVMIPELRQKIKYIIMKLDENERSTQIRLMKVKDMTLEKAHNYKRLYDEGV